MTAIKLKSLRECLLFLLVFLNVSCKGQIRIPDGYIETEPPKLYSKEWLSVGNSLHDFGLKIINGELLINPISESQYHELKIKGGLLRGMNHGEFGGELIYIQDGKPK